jgi:hypothetical protein
MILGKTNNRKALPSGAAAIPEQEVRQRVLDRGVKSGNFAKDRTVEAQCRWAILRIVNIQQYQATRAPAPASWLGKRGCCFCAMFAGLAEFCRTTRPALVSTSSQCQPRSRWGYKMLFKLTLVIEVD